MQKVTDGLNDRSKDNTIAQSGPGLPDDSGAPIEVSDAEVERIRKQLERDTSKNEKP